MLFPQNFRAFSLTSGQNAINSSEQSRGMGLCHKRYAMNVGHVCTGKETKTQMRIHSLQQCRSHQNESHVNSRVYLNGDRQWYCTIIIVGISQRLHSTFNELNEILEYFFVPFSISLSLSPSVF